MPRRFWSASPVVLGWIAIAVAPRVGQAMERRSVHPLECFPAVALTVTVEDFYRPASTPSRARALEGRLLAAAQKILAEAGVASDPKGRDLHLEVLGHPDGAVRIVLSPRGGSASGKGRPWGRTSRVDFEEREGEAPSAEEIEAAEDEQIEEEASSAIGWALGTEEACLPRRYSSAKGRFVLELPPTNGRARQGYLRRLLDLPEGEKVGAKPWVAMFERTPKGELALLDAFQLERGPTYPEEILVGESGYFVVRSLTRRTIYRPDGPKVRSFSIEDLLTPADTKRLLFNTQASVSLDDESDRLVVSLQGTVSLRHVELDLRTGLPIELLRDILPRLRAESVAYGGDSKRPWRPAVCVGEPVDFASPDLRREASSRFHARASIRPLPEYTEFARRARLQGTIDVEAVVSETGKVLCARVSEFPMGLPKAVEAVVLRWRFQPVVEEGRPVPTIGRIAIRFHEIDPLDER